MPVKKTQICYAVVRTKRCDNNIAQLVLPETAVFCSQHLEITDQTKTNGIGIKINHKMPDKAAMVFVII